MTSKNKNENNLHRKELGIKEFEEPDYCANCGSNKPMNFHTSSINGQDGIPGWICEDCGHTHFEKDSGPKYNNKLTADQQLKMEEGIAATIFEQCDADEDACADLGREILKMVLKQFRPDLFT